MAVFLPLHELLLAWASLTTWDVTIAARGASTECEHIAAIAASVVMKEHNLGEWICNHPTTPKPSNCHPKCSRGCRGKYCTAAQLTTAPHSNGTLNAPLVVSCVNGAEITLTCTKPDPWLSITTSIFSRLASSCTLHDGLPCNGRVRKWATTLVRECYIPGWTCRLKRKPEQAETWRHAKRTLKWVCACMPWCNI